MKTILNDFRVREGNKVKLKYVDWILIYPANK